MAMKDLGFKKSTVSKIKMPRGANSWLTNAGKSIGVASLDVLNDVMPASAQMVTSAAEAMTDFRSQLQELRSQRNNLKSAMEKNVYVDIARSAKANTIEALKTGNLYHGTSYDDGFGDMDFGDMDFGDDGDWDVGDDGDYDVNFDSDDGMTSVSTTHKNKGDIDVNNVRVNVDVGENSKLAQAMNANTQAIERQTQVSVDTSRVATEYNKAFNQTLLSHLTKTGESTSRYLGSIDSNLSSLVSINETISKSAALSAKYYEDSMAVFNQIVELMQPKNNNPDVSGYDKYGTNVADDIFSGGILNFKEYKQLVGKQLKSAVAGNMFLSQISNILEQPDELKAIMSHPLDMVIRGSIEKMIPTMLKEAAAGFDESLKEFGTSYLYKLRGFKGSDNPILDFIGQSLGIGNRLKTTVDKANYQRGKVDWNGESHKTLNEVIPYYLRKIASAVTGTQEVGFDYEKGVFRNVSDMKKEYNDDVQRYLVREYSGFISDFKDMLSKTVVFDNKKHAEEAEKQMEKFFANLVKTDGLKAYSQNKNGSFQKYVSENLGLSQDDPIVQAISAFIDTRSNADKHRMFGSMALQSRANVSKKLVDIESGKEASNHRYVGNGVDVLDSHLVKDKNGNLTSKVKYGSSPFIEVDKHGKTITTYARDIYKLLLSGITVYPDGSSNFSRGQVYGPPVPNVRGMSSYASKFEYNKGLILDDKDGITESKSRSSNDNISQDKLDKEVNRGKIRIQAYGDYGNGQLREQIVAQETLRQREAAASEGKDSFFARMFDMKADSTPYKIAAKVKDWMTKPGELGKDIFNSADKFLYQMVFGTDGEDASLFKSAISAVKDQATDLGKWFKYNIFEPLSEHLFGDEGIITKIKESQFWETTKNYMDKLATYAFGEKDEDGHRNGTIFSGAYNTVHDFGKSVKDNLFGENDSIFAQAKASFQDAFSVDGGTQSIALTPGVNISNIQDPEAYKEYLAQINDYKKQQTALKLKYLKDTGRKDIKAYQAANPDATNVQALRHFNTHVAPNIEGYADLQKKINSATADYNNYTSLTPDQLRDEQNSIVDEYVEKLKEDPKFADKDPSALRKLAVKEARKDKRFIRNEKRIKSLNTVSKVKHMTDAGKIEGQMASGGTVRKLGMYLLSPGEKVIPNKQLSKKDQEIENKYKKLYDRWQKEKDEHGYTDDQMGQMKTAWMKELLDIEESAKNVQKKRESIEKYNARVDEYTRDSRQHSKDVRTMRKLDNQYTEERIEEMKTTDPEIYHLYHETRKRMVDFSEKYADLLNESSVNTHVTLDEFKDNFNTGSTSVLDALFGENNGEKTASSIMNEWKEAGAAKLVAHAGAGLIGSIFLPGGPVAGAAMGLASGLVKNSETLQNVLFGKINEEGEREGGMINKDLYDMFANNKTGMAIGAGVGLIAKMGFLPAMLGPAGPVGGAILGLGASIAFKSKAMQKFLFGDDEAGTSGILGKFGAFFKNAQGVTDGGRFIDAGIGAGVGLLTTLFLPGSPLINSILGAAVGFSARSEGMQRFLFGEKNEDGKREGGIFGKLADGITNLVKPGIQKMQASLMHGIERHVIIPLQTGMKPIIHLGKDIFHATTGAISKTFTALGNGVKHILFGKEGKGGLISPFMQKVGKSLVHGISEIGGWIIGAPFHLISAIGKTIDLGKRVRNLLSPVIDLVIKPVIGLMGKAITKVTSTVIKGALKLATFPLRLPGIIMRKVTDGIKNSKLGEKFRNSFIGKGISNILYGKADEDGKRNGGIVGAAKGLKGLVTEASTRRYRWEKQEGSWLPKIVYDTYDVTGDSRVSLKDEQKAHKEESKLWKLYQYAQAGDKKARNKLIKLGGRHNANIEEVLFNSGEKFGRNAFDDLLGMDSEWWGGTKASAKRDKDRMQERNAEHMNVQEMKADKIAVSSFEISKASMEDLIDYIEYAKSKSSKYLDKSDEYKAEGNEAAAEFNDKRSRKFLEQANKFQEEVDKRRAASTEEIAEGEAVDEPVEGSKFLGGLIKKSGLYALSKGETVTPNPKKERWYNKLIEKFTIKKNNENVIRSATGDDNFTDENGQATDAMTGTMANKSKAEENAELQATIAKGAYNLEAKLKAEKEAAEQAKEDAFRSTLLDKISNLEGSANEQNKSWSDIFGKGGILTLKLLGLAALLPAILNGLKNLIPRVLGDMSSTFFNVIDDIKFGWDSIGGLPGFVNNVKEQIDSVATAAGLKPQTHIAVNPDDTISLDENGNFATYTDSNIKSLGERVKQFIFPEQTRIDVDGSITGTEGAAYTMENTYDSMSGAKINAIGTTARRVKRAIVKPKSIKEKIFSGVVKGTYNGVKNAPKHIANGAKALSTTTKNITSKLPGLSSKLTDTAVSLDSVSNKGMVEKFVTLVQKPIEYLRTHLDEFLSKHVKGKKAGNVASIIKKLTDCINVKRIMSCAPDFLKTFVQKVGLAVSKAAAAAASFLLSDVAMGITSGIIGACNAENMFQCDFDSLDFSSKMKLRAIAGLWKGIAGTSWGGWIDLANSLFFALTGTDFITELCLFLFDAISNDEQELSLKNARDDFKAEYTNYVQDEYNKYVAHAQANGQEYMDFESFKQSEVATSFDDYNIEQHKTVGKRIFDGIKNFGTSVKKFGTSVKSGTSNVVGAINSKVGETIDKIKESDTFKKVSQIPSNVLTMFNAARTGDFKTYVTIGKNTDKNKGFSDILVGKMYGTLRSFMLPLAITGTAIKFVKDKFNESGFSVSDITNDISKMWDYTKSGELKALNSYLPTDSEGDNDTLGNAIQVVAVNTFKRMFRPIATVTSGIKFVKDKFKESGASISDITNDISKMWDYTKSGELKALNSYLPTDSEGDNDTLGNAIQVVAVNTFKRMFRPIATVTSGIKFVKDKFKESGASVSDLSSDFKNLWGHATSGNLSEFISYKPTDSEGDNDKFGTVLSTIAVSVGKWVLRPVALIGSVFNGAKTLFDTVTGSIDRAITSGNTNSQNVINKAKSGQISVFSSEYWHGMGSTEGGIGGVLSTIASFSLRLVNAIPILFESVFGEIGEFWQDPIAYIYGDVTGSGSMSNDTKSKIQSSALQIASSIGSVSKNLAGNGDNPDVENNFPYYSQTDSSLRNKPYKLSNGQSGANLTMGARGCGPTALAMVASKLKGGYGNAYSPENMARLAEAGNYSTTAGTTPNYFTEVGTQLGMNVTPATATADNISSMLRSGQPVIIQGQSTDKSSPYTSSGHYVVGVGMDKNGNVLVNDPNGRSKSKAYPMNRLTKGGHLAFGFSNGGFGSTFRGNTVLIKSLMSQLATTIGSKTGSTTSGLPKSTGTSGSTMKDEMMGNTSKMTGPTIGAPSTTGDPLMPGISGIESFTQDKLNMKYSTPALSMAASASWVSIVKAVKAAIASQNVGYSKSNYITINVGTGNIRVRTDCSGFVGACLAAAGKVPVGQSTSFTSGTFCNTNNSSLTSAGFVPVSWNGWDTLVQGDIIAKPGHVEIFAYNENGAHYVYNCGGDNSCNNPGATRAANSSYTTVWRSTDVSTNAIPMANYVDPVTGSVSGGSNTKTKTVSNGINSFSSVIGKLTSAVIDPINKFLWGEDTSEETVTIDDPTSVSNYLWKFFSSKGYSSAAIAGILGNLQAESGLNPAAIQHPSQHAAGIAQWESYKNQSSRWLNLKNYAASKGKDWTDLTSQAEFIDMELRGLGSTFWNHASNMSKAGTTGTTFDQWMRSTDVNTATRQFEGAFERAGKINMEKRLNYANAWYNTYAKMGDFTSPDNVKQVGNTIAAMGGNGNYTVGDITEQLAQYDNNLDLTSDIFVGNGSSPSKYSVSRGGYGNYRIDKAINNYDTMMKETGGFGGYDDSSVVGLLSSMLSELKGTNSGINKFNEKDFGGNGDTINYYDGKSTNVNVSKESKSPKKTIKNPSKLIDPAVYKVAKKVAKGLVTT